MVSLGYPMLTLLMRLSQSLNTRKTANTPRQVRWAPLMQPPASEVRLERRSFLGELRRITLPRRWVNRDVRSAHSLELVQLPALVEPCLQWSVEAEDREPRLVGQRLDPVGLLTLWCPR